MSETRGKLIESPSESTSSMDWEAQTSSQTATAENVELQYHNCETCNLSYDTAEGLECHNKNCHLDLVEKCFDCGKNCKTKDILKNHIKTNHKNEYQCPLDGKRFLHMDELCEHMRQSHKGFNFLKCFECETKFDNPKGRIEHFYRDHTIKCVFCFYTTISSYKDVLVRHIITCPLQNLEGEFTRCIICPICNRGKFISKDLIQHFLKDHSDMQIFQCTKNCSKRWFNGKDLASHECPSAKPTSPVLSRKRKLQVEEGGESSECKKRKETEPDDPEYVCEVNSCNKGFDSIVGFMRHLREIHPEEYQKLDNNEPIVMLSFKIESYKFGQPVISPISEGKFLLCGRCKCFIYDMKKMKNHNESSHKRTAFCKACGCAFKSKKELDNHSLHHKKVKCLWEDCEGYFNSETLLYNHEKVHYKLFKLKQLAEEETDDQGESQGSKSPESSQTSNDLPVRSWCAFCKIKLSKAESASHSCLSVEGEAAAASSSSVGIYSSTSQELERGDSNPEIQPPTLQRESTQLMVTCLKCGKKVLITESKSHKCDSDESVTSSQTDGSNPRNYSLFKKRQC